MWRASCVLQATSGHEHAPFRQAKEAMTVQLRRKRFDRPDEVRVVEKARVELVELGSWP